MKEYPRIQITKLQKRKLEDIWFIYGNRGPKHSDRGHKFIQRFLDMGQDLRRLYKPPKEVLKAVDAILKDKKGVSDE